MVKIKTDCMRLSEMRIRQGMNCAELADKAGVTRQAISKIERGCTPGPALAKKIVEVLNVPYDCIFSIVEDSTGDGSH